MKNFLISNFLFWYWTSLTTVRFSLKTDSLLKVALNEDNILEKYQQTCLARVSFYANKKIINQAAKLASNFLKGNFFNSRIEFWRIWAVLRAENWLKSLKRLKHFISLVIWKRSINKTRHINFLNGKSIVRKNAS